MIYRHTYEGVYQVIGATYTHTLIHSYRDTYNNTIYNNTTYNNTTYNDTTYNDTTYNDRTYNNTTYNNTKGSIQGRV